MDLYKKNQEEKIEFIKSVLVKLSEIVVDYCKCVVHTRSIGEFEFGQGSIRMSFNINTSKIHFAENEFDKIRKLEEKIKEEIKDVKHVDVEKDSPGIYSFVRIRIEIGEHDWQEMKRIEKTNKMRFISNA